MKNKKYKFIIIEGVDGSGKTTLVHQLASAMKAYTVYEPGGIPGFRQMLKNQEFTSEQLSLLFMADRLAVHQLVREYLKESDVVSDRGFPSSYVYQYDVIRQVTGLHNLYQNRLVIPDKIYVLDISFDDFKKRRGADQDLLDKFAQDNFDDIRMLYQTLPFPNVSVLDGTIPTSDLVDIICGELYA